MASLKSLRVRIRSVKSTQKITSAMKVVAASRLRRAQEQAEAARPYAVRMGRMLGSLAAGAANMGNPPRLLAGTGREDTHLLIVATSDRGLAGGFNATILRETRRAVRELQGQGKTVKIFTIGRKARDGLRREYGRFFVDGITDIDRPRLDFSKADAIARKMLVLFEEGQFDVASIVYNRFKSAMTQIVTKQQLVPFEVPESADKPDPAVLGVYEYEPEEADLLASLLPRNLAVQLFTALLENAASEQGARMTAMDSATRNAGEMIDKLTITYNRSRQAAITKELIEIISGAEAL